MRLILTPTFDSLMPGMAHIGPRFLTGRGEHSGNHLAGSFAIR